MTKRRSRFACWMVSLILLALLAGSAQAQVFVMADYVCPSLPGTSPTSMAGAVIKIGDQQFTSKFEGNLRFSSARRLHGHGQLSR